MGVTYYVALPFVRNEDGELVPSEAQERQTASDAVRAAETCRVRQPVRRRSRSLRHPTMVGEEPALMSSAREGLARAIYESLT